MATITIPSPSAFLDSPVLQTASAPEVYVKKAPKKRPNIAKARRHLVEADNATTKPKQTKSRDGCKNCKEKRLKCDETKPTCVQCEKKGVICKGYEKILKWRPQEDTFRSSTGPQRPRKNSNTAKPARQNPASPVPSDSCPLQYNAAFAASTTHHTSDQRPQDGLSSQLSQHTNPPDPNESTSGPAIDSGRQLNTRLADLPDSINNPSSTPSLSNGSMDEDATPQSAKSIELCPWMDHSPQMLHIAQPEMDLDIPPGDPMDYQPENDSTTFSHGLPGLEKFSSYVEHNVEEIPCEQGNAGSWLIPMASPTSSESSGSSSGSWVDAFAVSIWNQPRMHHDSEETLMLRFDKQTCGILSIKDGPSENPWRTMLWPLAKDEGALRHAITSLTAFHASKESPGLRIKGMEHMNHSLQLLSHGIHSMPLTTSLATTLVLAFCESWDMLISTGIRHLRGASHLVAQIMANYRQRKTFPENEPRLGFLCRTWVYMDVIARLTSLEGDDSTDFDIVGTSLCQPFVVSQEIDPLMGCASTLFPTIGRVANLVRRVRQRTQSNSLQIISIAKELKSRLEKWVPPSMFAAPEDHWTEVEQGLWTAEAYRGATLLYLLQAVPEICYDSVTETIAALAKEVLTHIANVPVTSGMVIIHIFPLLAAGCEAMDEESRMFVVERWQAMMRRMNIQNLDRCLDVVKEVWDRRDQALLEIQRRKARLAASNCQTGYLPKTIMKRKYSSSDDTATDSPDEGKRRAIQSAIDSCSSKVKPASLRRDSSGPCGGLDYELTVRGRHHWAGVMKDLRWEGDTTCDSVLSQADAKQSSSVRSTNYGFSVGSTLVLLDLPLLSKG